MDGLIIDSEPLWKKGEIEIFGEQGIHLSPEMCGETEGLGVVEVVDYWDHQFPGKIFDKENTVNNINLKVGSLIYDEGEALPGVYELINFFKSMNLPIALASASTYYIIDIVVKKLKLEQSFQVIQSTQKLNYGKPHPQVFIEAANKMEVNPIQCLVFEDSLFGVLAGKAARMKVVAVPYPHNAHKKGYCIADEKLESLSQFSPQLFNKLCR